jgi:5'-phosphate synthase pdxT subunit
MVVKTVGVLALQGDFAAHEAALTRIGAEPIQIRNADQLKSIDGLIIPGGESTTMLKLLRYDGMMEPLAQFMREKPVFGTCAGAILLAKAVTHPAQESFGAMDIGVERNGYGRQNESRIAEIDPEPEFRQRAGGDKMETVFIRAPIIRRTGTDVKILARYNGDPILVEQDRHMAATFHPELTADTRVHKWFLGKLRT